MSVITLRIPEDLKRRLGAAAEFRGESLNHYIESIAVQALVAEETVRRIEMRRARGKAATALAVLYRVPNRAPMAPDEPAPMKSKRAAPRPPQGRTKKSRP